LLGLPAIRAAHTAFGIDLVFATKRTSIQVVSDEIKANLTARVACGFRVSRTR
jgi:DNA segregation ATPase FtsK/SpoIIIE-like protein